MKDSDTLSFAQFQNIAVFYFYFYPLKQAKKSKSRYGLFAHSLKSSSSRKQS